MTTNKHIVVNEYGYQCTLVFLLVADLHVACETNREDVAGSVDEQLYQRLQTSARAKKIARAYMPEAFDPILVARRPDGSFWIIDGAARAAAYVILGRTHILARVYEVADIAQEAELFRVANTNRTAIKKYDLYRAGLIAGDPDVIEIQRIVTEFGFTVSHGSAWPHISCVAKLMRAQHYKVLGTVLWVVRATWPMQKEALRETSIGSLTEFFHHFRALAKPSRCVTKWKRLDPGNFPITGRRNELAAGGRYRAIAMELMRTYNGNLTDSRRLKWD